MKQRTRASRGLTRSLSWLAMAWLAAVVLAATAGGCSLSREGGLSVPCTADSDCDDGNTCSDDFCSDDGICNANPADHTGSLPQTPDDCKQDVCDNGHITAVADENDKPDNPCTNSVCNGATLEETAKGDGEACEVGSGHGYCETGECVVACTADNAASVCNDDNPCTDDSCDLTVGRCAHEPQSGEPPIPDEPYNCHILLCVKGELQDLNDDSDLPDDGNPCTDDVCTNGDISNPALPPGTVCGKASDNHNLVCDDNATCVGCNQGTDCNGTDTTCRWRTCNNGNCSTEDAQNGTGCDDQVYCNGTDSCSGGTCSQHAGNPCPGPDGDGDCSESCNENANNCSSPDSNGSVCFDAMYCNGSDTCSSGSCNQHSGNPCPGADGDGDCSESCNETADNCSANDPNGSGCNDSLYCTTTDKCNGSGSCVGSGNPCPGPDGDGDCSESCNESNNDCSSNDPNGSSCNDGQYCTQTDKCNGSGSCVGSGNPCPGPDGDGDCSESCNETADNCSANDPNGSGCNDGQYCTQTDTCSGGSCTGSGDPCPGPDGDGDCSESCNESNNDCSSNDPNGSSCNDGQYCTQTDTCSGGSCTGSGDPCAANIGDCDNNCSESCNESNNDCSADDPIGSTCQKGGSCNNSCDGNGNCN